MRDLQPLWKSPVKSSGLALSPFELWPFVLHSWLLVPFCPQSCCCCCCCCCSILVVVPVRDIGSNRKSCWDRPNKKNHSGRSKFRTQRTTLISVYLYMSHNFLGYQFSTHTNVFVYIILYIHMFYCLWIWTKHGLVAIKNRLKQFEYCRDVCQSKTVDEIQSLTLPIGSMDGIYANIVGILMESMLPYIAAPWILWVIVNM